jgi:hypothetical protein
MSTKLSIKNFLKSFINSQCCIYSFSVYIKREKEYQREKGALSSLHCLVCLPFCFCSFFFSFYNLEQSKRDRKKDVLMAIDMGHLLTCMWRWKWSRILLFIRYKFVEKKEKKRKRVSFFCKNQSANNHEVIILIRSHVWTRYRYQTYSLYSACICSDKRENYHCS